MNCKKLDCSHIILNNSIKKTFRVGTLMFSSMNDCHYRWWNHSKSNCIAIFGFRYTTIFFTRLSDYYYHSFVIRWGMPMQNTEYFVKIANSLVKYWIFTSWGIWNMYYLYSFTNHLDSQCLWHKSKLEERQWYPNQDTVSFHKVVGVQTIRSGSFPQYVVGDVK